MRGHHDRPQRRLGVVHAAARGGPRDQPRGHPPDARVRRDGAGLRRARALRPRLDRIRRRHPRRTASPSATSTSARSSTTPTSSPSSRPSSWSARGPSCRRRSCARASSSATVAAAGRRRSTSSTGRCARSRGACSRPVPAVARRPGRRGLGRLRGRRRSTSCARVGRDRRDLPPDRRRRRRARSLRSPAGQPLLQAPGAEGALARRVRGPARRLERRADAWRGAGLLPVLLDQDASSTTPPRGRGWSRPGSASSPLARLPGPAAGLRHAQPLGQAADRARRGARLLARALSSHSNLPPSRGVVRRARLPRPGAERDAPAMLADTARFRPDDPDVLVHRLAGLSDLPGRRRRGMGRGTRGIRSVRRMSLREPARTRWRVYLAPDQALRLGLMHAHAG